MVQTNGGFAMAKRRFPRVLPLAAALLALLVAAPLAGAVKAPGLASSSQYKAFVEFVKKMEERSTQPTSTETKNRFEAKLTAKETAAKHKANALFQRAAEEAKEEANATAGEQVSRVKAKEGEELEAVHGETAGKLERVEAAYRVKYEHIVSGHHTREVALKQQISELRGKKAKAAPGQPKEVIQERIEAKSAEIAANHEDEKTKRTELKAATGKKKAAIAEKAETTEAEINEGAAATIKKIDNHWNQQYLEKKAALNTTRENRLGYLESKLEQGRAAIAAMPAND
jgi:hypothetical protein